jgi:hypothetical protein
VDNTINIVEQDYLEEEQRPRRSHNISAASCVYAREGEDPSLVGECLRAAWFAWMGAERTNPAMFSNQTKMALGKMLELSHVARLAKHVPVIPQFECRWHVDGMDYDIHGYADGLLFRPDAGKFTNLTVKAPASFKVKEQKKYGPNAGYRLQVLVECAVILRQYPKIPLDEIRHVTISRSDGYPDEVAYPLDADEASRVFDLCVSRWIVLEAHLKRDELPPPEYRDLNDKGPFEHWRCRFCGWRDLCQSKEDPVEANA